METLSGEPDTTQEDSQDFSSAQGKLLFYTSSCQRLLFISFIYYISKFQYFELYIVFLLRISVI